MLPEIPIPTTYSDINVRFSEENLMSDIASAMDRLIHRFRDLELTLRELEDKEAIKKYAHLQAFNTVQSKAWEFFTNELKRATAETVEYNIPIFTDRMDEALEFHKDVIISIQADDPGDIYVIVDMYYLGDPEQYASAVRSARGTLGVGKIPDADVRSDIWEEKIYGVDREGRSIEHPKTGEDITERYVGLYTRTIVERLEHISEPYIAPWWYFINYGNFDLFEGQTEEGAGRPYPQIVPTNFVARATQAIQDAFYDIYYNLIEEAERLYNELLEKDYGLKGVTPFAQEILDALDRMTLDELLALSKVAVGQETLITIRYDDTTWDLYKTSSGKIGARYNLSLNR